MASSAYRQGPAYNAPDTSELAPTQRGTSILGRYRIMESCGTGGFGTVLTCWDTRLQRRVAIKRMPLVAHADVPGMASTLAEGLAEARTSSMLAHPNIVTVFDFERDQDCAYLVMEYVDGITLTELLRRVEGGTLTPDECCYLVKSLASALSYAHENGVLHLDIKPSNIMIDRTGQIKLCDFGMATLASATGYGDARGGTVGYMPPEQIEGQVVDERADVFSLAVVVWQALTGENPFAAPSAEQSLALIERGPKTQLSKLVPDAAGMTEQALLGALEPNPAVRTASVTDFANEVTFALGDSQEGKTSMHHLLSQTGEQEPEDDEAVAAELPLNFRYPWIESALARVLAAVSAGMVAYRVAPFVVGSTQGVLIATAVSALAGAVWTPLASAIALLLVAFALLTVTSGAASILLCAIFAALGVVWWAFAGWKSRHASASVLAPAALRAPAASAALAGAFLTPGRAFATAAFAWIVCQVTSTSVAWGFDASGVARDLLEMAMRPQNWIVVMGLSMAAAAASAITRFRPSTVCSVLGQVVGVALACGIQLLAARVENGGIWAAPTWDTVGIAVVLGVFACACRIVSGPAFEDQEADEDEYA